MPTQTTSLLRYLAGLLSRTRRVLAPILSQMGMRLRPGVRRLAAQFSRLSGRSSPVGRRVRDGRARIGQLPKVLGLVVASALAAGAVTLVVGSVHYTTCGFQSCPDVAGLFAWQPGGASVLLDRNGEPFADLAPFERSVVRLEDLPGHLPAAFIAVEDRRFRNHRGIDWIRVVGALVANVRAGGVAEGSSTITMQLARNVFPRDLPGAERTYRRKLREVRVARLLERQFGKDEILELYLNHIYFGGGAYGVDAASHLYFDKPPSELTVAEAALLAALPKAPAHYDPRRQPEGARARRDLVLRRMEREEVISVEQAAEARTSEVQIAPRNHLPVALGGYFVDLVRDLLEEEFGESLYSLRLTVHTTLDRTAQQASEEEMAAHLGSLSGTTSDGDNPIQGAFVLLDARTGAVRALVGGDPSAVSRYNRAVLGTRQLGSAFKPFVFAAALDAGVPTSRILMDQPLRMDLSRGDVWTPSNYDGLFEGGVTMREALVRSRNVPTIRLAADVGIGGVARMARSAGITSTMDETPSLALGTVATSPVEVASAYTAFATLGHTALPHLLVRVESEDGAVLWEPPLAPPLATIDPAVAYIVTDMLRDAVNRGTGAGVRAAGYRGVVAGKTGTTNAATDAWFIGYTPEVVGAVWIGRDRPSSLGNTATGGGLAAPMWGRILARAGSLDVGARDWVPPAGVMAWTVDGESGLLLAEGCDVRGQAAPRTELFLASNLPETVCPTRERNVFARLWSRIRGGGDQALTPRLAAPVR